MKSKSLRGCMRISANTPTRRSASSSTSAIQTIACFSFASTAAKESSANKVSLAYKLQVLAELAAESQRSTHFHSSGKEKTRELFIALRTAALDPNASVRISSLRALRRVSANLKDFRLGMDVHVDFPVSLSLQCSFGSVPEEQHHWKLEVMEALKFIESLAGADRLGNVISRRLVKALVAVASNTKPGKNVSSSGSRGKKKSKSNLKSGVDVVGKRKKRNSNSRVTFAERDSAVNALATFRCMCVEVIRGIAIRNTALVAACGGIELLFTSVLDAKCVQEGMLEPLVNSLLYICNDARSRCHIPPGLGLHSLLWPFSAAAAVDFRSSKTSTFTQEDIVSQSLTREASRRALLIMMQSHAGVLLLATNPLGLRPLVQLPSLPMTLPVRRRALLVLEQLCDIVCPPSSERRNFTGTHGTSTDTSQTHEPSWTTARRLRSPDAIDSFSALLLLALLHCGLVKSLATLALEPDHVVATAKNGRKMERDRSDKKDGKDVTFGVSGNGKGNQRIHQDGKRMNSTNDGDGIGKKSRRRVMGDTTGIQELVNRSRFLLRRILRMGEDLLPARTNQELILRPIVRRIHIAIAADSCGLGSMRASLNDMLSDFQGIFYSQGVVSGPSSNINLQNTTMGSFGTLQWFPSDSTRGGSKWSGKSLGRRKTWASRSRHNTSFSSGTTSGAYFSKSVENFVDREGYSNIADLAELMFVEATRIPSRASARRGDEAYHLQGAFVRAKSAMRHGSMDLDSQIIEGDIGRKDSRVYSNDTARFRSDTAGSIGGGLLGAPPDEFKALLFSGIHPATGLSISSEDLQDMLSASKVISTKDYRQWNWAVICELLIAPVGAANPNMLSDLLQTKFIARLGEFFQWEVDEKASGLVVQPWSACNQIYAHAARRWLSLLLSQEDGIRFLSNDRRGLLPTAVVLALKMEKPLPSAEMGTNAKTFWEGEGKEYSNLALVVQAGFITAPTPPISHIFSQKDFQSTMARELIPLLAILIKHSITMEEEESIAGLREASGRGITAASSAGIVQKRKVTVSDRLSKELLVDVCALIKDSKNDYIVRLLLMYLDYTQEYSRELMDIVLDNSKSWALKRFVVILIWEMMRLEVLSKSEFADWGITKLKTQLHQYDEHDKSDDGDERRRLAELAEIVLEEASLTEEYIAGLIQMSPPVGEMQARPAGRPILLRMTSIPDGLKYLGRHGWVDNALERWFNREHIEYTRHLEKSLLLWSPDKEDKDLEVNRDTTSFTKKTARSYLTSSEAAESTKIMCLHSQTAMFHFGSPPTPIPVEMPKRVNRDAAHLLWLMRLPWCVDCRVSTEKKSHSNSSLPHLQENSSGSSNTEQNGEMNQVDRLQFDSFVEVDARNQQGSNNKRIFIRASVVDESDESQCSVKIDSEAHLQVALFIGTHPISRYGGVGIPRKMTDDEGTAVGSIDWDFCSPALRREALDEYLKEESWNGGDGDNKDTESRESQRNKDLVEKMSKEDVSVLHNTNDVSNTKTDASFVKESDHTENVDNTTTESVARRSSSAFKSFDSQLLCINTEWAQWIFRVDYDDFGRKRSSSSGSNLEISEGDRKTSSSSLTDTEKVSLKCKPYLRLVGIEVELDVALLNAESRVPMPPHLHGEIARSSAGCALLERSNHIPEFLRRIEDESTPAIVRRSAVVAIGQIASCASGLQLLQRTATSFSRILVTLAKTADRLSLRGSCIFALGLVARTDAGVRELRRYGWASPSDGINIKGSGGVVSIPVNPGLLFNDSLLPCRGEHESAMMIDIVEMQSKSKLLDTNEDGLELAFPRILGHEGTKSVHDLRESSIRKSALSEIDTLYSSTADVQERRTGDVGDFSISRLEYRRPWMPALASEKDEIRSTILYHIGLLSNAIRQTKSERILLRIRERHVEKHKQTGKSDHQNKHGFFSARTGEKSDKVNDSNPFSDPLFFGRVCALLDALVFSIKARRFVLFSLFSSVIVRGKDSEIAPALTPRSVFWNALDKERALEQIGREKANINE